MKSRYTKLICNFKLRNIQVECFETLEEAKKEILMKTRGHEDIGTGPDLNPMSHNVAD